MLSKIKLKQFLIMSMLLVGLTAIASQIVYMRELLIVFYGNEISVGIIFAGWFVWGAAGSWLLGRFSDKIRSKLTVFAISQLILAAALPFVLILIRNSKNILGFTAGEIMGYSSMIFITFISLLVPCAVMAFMFSLSCAIYRNISTNAHEGVGRIYTVEAIGALAGGAIVTLFIFLQFPSLYMLLFLSFLNLAAFSINMLFIEKTALRKKAFLISVILFAVLLNFTLSYGARYLNGSSLKALWKGFDWVQSKDSVYGNITITKRGEQVSFYENGLHLYTVPDKLFSEYLTHFALCQVQNPEDVLLIGGGVGGVLTEVLKYPNAKIDYVELDPVIVGMAKEHLKGAEEELALDRVNVINEDGRFFVKRTNATYDAVIVSLGDPYTAQINRFYTVEFYNELASILKEGAVVSFSLTSQENYISNELKDYLRSIYLSLKQVFPEVVLIPGDTIHFIATNKKGMLFSQKDMFIQRMEKRGIAAEYFRDYYLFDMLSPKRLEDIDNRIKKGGEVLLNRDFRPISYYYATVFWGTHFDKPFVQNFIKGVTPRNIYLAVILFCLLAFLFCNVSVDKRRERAVSVAIMTTGFAEIIFQITVLLSFQVIYGYVYYKLGVIITSFMVGLALGGWVITKYLAEIKNDTVLFYRTQIAICFYPLILPIVFFVLANTKNLLLSWFGANVFLPLLPVIAGFIGGVQFPLANKICVNEGTNFDRPGRVAAINYGMDLAGACFGAFLAAAFLIPILGIFKVCLLSAFINFAVLLILLSDVAKRRK